MFDRILLWLENMLESWNEKSKLKEQKETAIRRLKRNECPNCGNDGSLRNKGNIYQCAVCKGVRSFVFSPNERTLLRDRYKDATGIDLFGKGKR